MGGIRDLRPLWELLPYSYGWILFCFSRARTLRRLHRLLTFDLAMRMKRQAIRQPGESVISEGALEKTIGSTDKRAQNTSQRARNLQYTAVAV